MMTSVSCAGPPKWFSGSWPAPCHLVCGGIPPSQRMIPWDTWNAWPFVYCILPHSWMWTKGRGRYPTGRSRGEIGLPIQINRWRWVSQNFPEERRQESWPLERGDSICKWVELAPELCPTIVMDSGLPPKLSMLFLTHSSANVWSNRP